MPSSETEMQIFANQVWDIRRDYVINSFESLPIVTTSHRELENLKAFVPFQDIERLHNSVDIIRSLVNHKDKSAPVNMVNILSFFHYVLNQSIAMPSFLQYKRSKSFVE
jgi:hypothetical protein